MAESRVAANYYGTSVQKHFEQRQLLGSSLTEQIQHLKLLCKFKFYVILENKIIKSHPYVSGDDFGVFTGMAFTTKDIDNINMRQSIVQLLIMELDGLMLVIIPVSVVFIFKKPILSMGLE